mgnify:CR=1 FL=1
MNEDLFRKEMYSLSCELIETKRKLEIAITGLKLLISDGSDSFGIAQKTLDELDKEE